MCVLNAADDAGALVFCERFRKKVAETKIVYEGTHIPVTISLGTASALKEWPQDKNAEEAVKEMVGRADAALYYSKENGRNRTSQSETMPKKAAEESANKAAEARSKKKAA
jgi:GGDEF domain-containing protein